MQRANVYTYLNLSLDQNWISSGAVEEFQKKRRRWWHVLHLSLIKLWCSQLITDKFTKKKKSYSEQDIFKKKTYNKSYQNSKSKKRKYQKTLQTEEAEGAEALPQSAHSSAALILHKKTEKSINSSIRKGIKRARPFFQRKKII